MEKIIKFFEPKKHVIYYGWIIIAIVIGTRQTKKL